MPAAHMASPCSICPTYPTEKWEICHGSYHGNRQGKGMLPSPTYGVMARASQALSPMLLISPSAAFWARDLHYCPCNPYLRWHWHRIDGRGHKQGEEGKGGTERVAEDLKIIIYINLRAHGVAAENTIPPYFEAEIRAEINIFKKRFFFKGINCQCGKCHQEAAVFGEAAATWV